MCPFGIQLYPFLVGKYGKLHCQSLSPENQ
uniref:Si614032g01 n=1 Tax=Arundo donax TaxID=35708 RepID=A0A0A9FDD2_ARUDO